MANISCQMTDTLYYVDKIHMSSQNHGAEREGFLAGGRVPARNASPKRGRRASCGAEPSGHLRAQHLSRILP